MKSFCKRVLVLFLVGSIWTIVGQREAVADIIATANNAANGHTYYLLTTNSWTGSEAEAVTLGGHLATINDAAEQAFVFSTFGGFAGVNRSLWIGLNDTAGENTFVWTSGETPSYTNWSSGQPDGNTGAGEDFVHMINTGNSFGRTPGTWNDAPNAGIVQFTPFHGVVEITAVPEPSSMLLTLGAGAFVYYRHRRSRKLAATKSEIV